MPKIKFKSLRTRLIALIISAIIPALIFLMYTFYEQRKQREADIGRDAMITAKLAAHSLEQLFAGSYQVLSGITEVKAVREYDAQTCNAYVTAVKRKLPMYATIAAVKPDGDVFCSAVLPATRVNVADRLYFQFAVRTKRFALGEYLITRTYNRPAITAAMPVLDKRMNVRAVVFVSIDLRWFIEELGNIRIPSSAVLTVLDRNLTVLYRNPGSEKWVGKNTSNTELTRKKGVLEEGIATAAGYDGVERIWAFTAVHGMAEGITVRYGVARSTAFSDINLMLVKNVTTLLVITFFALLVAWFGSEYVVMRRMKLLQKAAAELEKGNLKARVDIGERGDEISQLGVDFNRMASSLERHQNELHKSEERHSAILQTAMDGFLLTDLQGNLLEVNDAYCRMSGYSAQELLTMSISDVDAVTTHEKVAEHVRKLITAGTDRFESKNRRRDGTVYDVEISTQYKAFEKGQIVSFLRDITERKRAEEALRESEERFKRLLLNSNDIFTVTDDKGVYSYLSGAVEKSIGYKPEELLGTNGFVLIHPDDVERVLKIFFEEIQKPGSIQRLEFRYRHKNGDWVWLETVGVNLLDDPVVRGVVLNSRDITERKRSEQQTTDALNFVRTMMENSPIGIVSINATGDVVAANEAISRMSGGTVSQLLMQNVRSIEPWRKYGLLAKMDEALAANSEKRIETHYISTFGKDLWLSVSFVPYSYQGERHVLVLLTDMTEQKRYEKDKERLHSQLMQAQKMEAIGQLAGGIAHDFNNILTAIIGYGSILQTKMKAKDSLRHNVDEIIASAGRAGQLTNSLLTFSRKQVLTMKPTDLVDIITKMEQFLRRIIGEDIEIKANVRGSIVILADSGQIEQVLMNLATNARDAMPRGGQLIIETDIVEIGDVFISAHGFGTEGQYAVLTVTDTGTGMDEETTQKIFEPFYTTKEVGRGTGLGLAIVYGIIKQHKGYINVYSHVGKGTTFKIYLPLHSEQLVKSDASAPTAPVLFGTETVLLAEDDAILRTFFKTILTEHGYTVVIADDGEDAIRKFKERKDDIQICLLDVIMPKKSGVEVYEAVWKIKPGIKVIFSSGYTADKVHLEGLPVGSAFISKPALPQVFLEKIREVLNG